MRDRAHANGFAWRLGAFYIAVFLVVGGYMPLLPVWLKERALSEFQIALIFAVPSILRPIFTPVITFAADRYGRPAGFLKWLAVGFFGACLLLPFTGGFATIFPVLLLYALCWMAVIPLTEAVALLGQRNNLCDYGHVRLWGSAAFIAMAVLGGMAVDRWGPPAVLWLLIGAALSVAVVAQMLMEPNGKSASHAVEGGGDGDGVEAVPAKKLRLADLLQLMRSTELWLLMIAASAIQSAHAVYYVFGTLHWTSIGISPTIVGRLWAVGVIAEILLFVFAERIGQRFGAVHFVLLGGVAAVLRWTCTAFDPPLAVLFVLQCLHGLTFGATHFGAMQFLRKAVPDRLAVSAQGIYAATTAGIGMGLMQLAAGPLYSTLHGRAYLVMAMLGAGGIAAALLLMRRWHDNKVVLVPAA